MNKRTDTSYLGSLGSGAVTGVAMAVQTGLAGVVGIIVARDFGRTAVTDGFFAAYAVFVVVLLAANGIRVIVLPPLARARDESRLGSEVTAYALTLAAFVVPLLLLAILAARQCAWLLTGGGTEATIDAASTVLPWMVVAAVLQLYAGLAASSLAALNDYVTPALGFVLGSAAGLVLILVRIDADGIVAVARGMALNGAIAVCFPLAVLARRAFAQAMPPGAIRPATLSFRSRLAEIGRGIALPFAIQGIYLVCVPLAAREGVGAVTSFGYAYLIASAIVAVTGSSLGLVTSVPLTRAGLDPDRISRHVVSSAWLAIVVVGAAAGVFGLAGGTIVHALLGSGYSAAVGSELGRLVVVFSLWAVVSVGISLTFPLLFVVRAGRRLPLLALLTIVVQIPLAVIGQLALGLDGLALALAATTAFVLASLLVDLDALRPTVRGLMIAAVTVALLALVAFVPPSLVLAPAAAAAAGLALYIVVLGLVRPAPLRGAWRYLRALA
jgi:O-antigen/teichoic acid export membrane protein